MSGRGAAATGEGRLYGVLAEVVSFPSRELLETVSSGLLRATVRLIAEALPFEARLPLAEMATGSISATTMEAEYIRLFDVPDRQPTPLYTGVYASRRRDAMEELLRIYRHFGLTVSGDAHDLPDYVPTVLEFLAFLADGATTAIGTGRESRERAAADILERHLCPWAAMTAGRLAKRDALPFYQGVVESIAALGGGHLRQLRQSYPVVGRTAAQSEVLPSR